MFRNIISVRVKRIGGAYYPQYKGFLFWKNFEKSAGYEAYMTNVVFGTFDEAKKYICENQEEYYYPSCRK